MPDFFITKIRQKGGRCCSVISPETYVNVFHCSQFKNTQMHMNQSSIKKSLKIAKFDNVYICWPHWYFVMSKTNALTGNIFKMLH